MAESTGAAVTAGSFRRRSPGDRSAAVHTTPKASIASATFLKPAIFAPFT